MKYPYKIPTNPGTNYNNPIEMNLSTINPSQNIM